MTTRFILLIGFLFLIDVYAFQAFKTAFSLNERNKDLFFKIYWGVSIFAFAAIIAAMFTNVDEWNKAFKIYLFASIIILYFSKLIIALFLIIDDVIRFFRWVFSFIGTKKASASVDIHTEQVKDGIGRLQFISRLALIMAAIPFTALIKGMMTGAYDYTVRNVRIKMPKLPQGFNGIRIVHISDIHIGSFMSTEPMKKAINMINEQKADLVLFTGDLVNNIASETDGFLDILKELKAPMGVYSTLGNHDYGDYHPFPSKEEKAANLNRLKAVHAQVGFNLLLNQNVTLERKGDKISLIGMENWGAYGHFSKYGDMKKSLAGIEETPVKILMSHDPSHWTEQVSKEYPDIDLTLSGHTHGMQFGIEIPGFKWSPIQYMYKHWAGLYTSNNQYLYVNRGLGFLAYPGRVGIMPEITVIELVS